MEDTVHVAVDSNLCYASTLSIRSTDFRVHPVEISFPSTIISCVENAPLVGHVSHVMAPGSRIECSQSSSKESSSESIQNVHISPRLMDEFMELARSNTEKDLETCGILGAFLENTTFYVTTLIIPKQEATSNSCQASNEEEICAIQEEISCCPVGWIHTHPSQTCFMSSIDLHTQYSYQMMLPAALAIVMAPTDASRNYGIFRLSEEGMRMLGDCQERGFHLHKETDDGNPFYEDCSNVYFNTNLRFEIIDLRCSP